MSSKGFFPIFPMISWHLPTHFLPLIKENRFQ
uniref:Uncharacterized protein n=1 Tax=Anguilla anguilla TaxID=7936 RepID=A0A0E9Q8U2_ANGAN